MQGISSTVESLQVSDRLLSFWLDESGNGHNPSDDIWLPKKGKEGLQNRHLAASSAIPWSIDLLNSCLICSMCSSSDFYAINTSSRYTNTNSRSPRTELMFECDHRYVMKISYFIWVLLLLTFIRASYSKILENFIA